jgi:hypothetical protein
MVSGAFLPLLKQAAAAKERALLINIGATLGSITEALACQIFPNKDIAYCLTKVRKIAELLRPSQHGLKTYVKNFFRKCAF